jgi:hypothetical protein
MHIILDLLLMIMNYSIIYQIVFKLKRMFVLSQNWEKKIEKKKIKNCLFDLLKINKYLLIKTACQVEEICIEKNSMANYVYLEKEK